MDVLPLPLRVTTKNVLLEAAAANISIFKQNLTEPVKVPLYGNTILESDEDEQASTITGRTTPDTRSSSQTAEPASPAFVAEDELGATMASMIALDTNKSLPLAVDSSVPAFIPQDLDWTGSCAFGTHMRSPQGLWQSGKTLSLQNVPVWYTQEMLLKELQDSGFRARRDFDNFNMPQDQSTGYNFGYCFINFVSEAVANSFEAAFHERTARLAEHAPAFQVLPTTIEDLEKIWMQHAMVGFMPKDNTVAFGASAPRQARFCPQCGSTADPNKYNFCSQCGASLAHLRQHHN